jgi:putative hydrolase of the HAD superfamily
MSQSSQLSTITTISFDGDGTLWDFEQVMRHSLRYALDELQLHVPGEQSSQLTIEEMIRIRDAVAKELKGKVVNLEEIRLIAFQRTLEHVGVKNDSLAGHLNKTYLKHRFEDIELYPDVIDALDILAKRFKIGLLSNGNNYPEKCGLAERFRFVVFSQDYGVEKPDQRIFEIALEKAGCSHSELLHVGDSLTDDVYGAKNAGIKSVWLNRDKKDNDNSVKPDYEITNLNKLRDVLDDME